jgi:hypothetical protein
VENCTRSRLPGRAGRSSTPARSWDILWPATLVGGLERSQDLKLSVIADPGSRHLPYAQLSSPGATKSAQSPNPAPATNFVHSTTGSLASSGPLALAASPRMLARSTSVALSTITNPVDGCLAVAVQIYSDSSDEVTGATLNGGETGGTWTKAGELLGVTGGVPTADRPRSSPRCRPPARSRAAASTRARPTRRTRSA